MKKSDENVENSLDRDVFGDVVGDARKRRRPLFVDVSEMPLNGFCFLFFSERRFKPMTLAAADLFWVSLFLLIFP